MKRKLLLLIPCLLTSLINFSQNVNIPDANFKAYLVGNTSINTNSDTEIQVSEAQAFTGMIDCQWASINDMTGLEAFIAVTELYCAGNSLTSLDISNNTALTKLNCSNNQLTSLDVSSNTGLTFLYCYDNLITSLDISLNVQLNEIECSYNPISTLDFSNNVSVEWISCGYTQITSLDLSLNTSLYSIWCPYGIMTSLTLPSSSSLAYVECYNNALTSLDLHTSLGLEYLDCRDNSLNTLSVANGNNSQISTLKAANNPALLCIEVDDVTYSTTNWTGANYTFDPSAGFSVDCNASSAAIENLSSIQTDLIISPNPAVDRIAIASPKKATAWITSSNGDLLHTFEINDLTTIDISTFSPGIYFLHTEGSVNRFIKE